MNHSFHIIRNETRDHVARTAVDLYAADCLKAVREERDFAVALSGGRSPLGFFKLLAADDRVTPAHWQKTHLFWVDERCVPDSDPASNFGAARRFLLDRVPLFEDHVHPMPGLLPPEDGARLYEGELVRHFGVVSGNPPRFDLVVLGVGADGHTASLFPGSKLIGEKKRLVMPVKGGNPDLWRLTLTFKVLNAAAHIMILATGKEKAPVVAALTGRSDWKPPVVNIVPVGGRLTLLVDKESAGDGDCGKRQK